MSTLYLIRHGQTLFNRLHRKQGWCDSPLTDEGIEQAKTTRRWLVGRHVTFDHAYASTSERACDFEVHAAGVHLSNCCVLVFEFDGEHFTVGGIESPNG